MIIAMAKYRRARLATRPHWRPERLPLGPRSLAEAKAHGQFVPPVDEQVVRRSQGEVVESEQRPGRSAAGQYRRRVGSMQHADGVNCRAVQLALVGVS